METLVGAESQTGVISLFLPAPGQHRDGNELIARFLFNLESAVLSGGILSVLCGPLQALQCLLCQPHESPQGPGER